MSEYKRLTNKDWKENYDIFEGVCCDTCAEDCGKCERNFSALVRLAELEDKIENGVLVELPCKDIEELDIIKDGMIFIFYKMCLEQNLGQGVFLEYKSKINEWFKSYLKKRYFI